VRLRIAEERHHAVAQELGDVPAQARYRVGGCAMVSGDRIAPFLGIELRGYRCGSNQVAEQHRQMTPLSGDFSRLGR